MHVFVHELDAATTKNLRDACHCSGEWKTPRKHVVES
jgi:hypothetical protein